MTAVRVWHLDTGGCGACAAEVWAAVESSPDLQWAPGPDQADVVALTGSVTLAGRDAVLDLYHTVIAGRLPVVAVGRCAIDGYPFGSGGLVTLGEIVVQARVEACPPLPTIILDTLLGVVISPQGSRP